MFRILMPIRTSVILLFFPLIFNVFVRPSSVTADTFNRIDNFRSSIDQRFLAGMNGDVLFGIQESTNAQELWISDGTPGGTRLLRSFSYLGSGIALSFQTRGSREFFLFVADDGNSGKELWITDGTPQGTEILVDLIPGINGVFSEAYDYFSAPTPSSFPASFAPFKGGALFVANDGVNGREPWFTDGTKEGTHFIKDIVPGSGSSFTSSGSAPDFTSFSDGSRVFFRAAISGSNIEPFVTDGTESGTHLVIDIEPGIGSSRPDHFTAFGNMILFSAFDSSSYGGIEPWISDGTGVGTYRLKDINTTKLVGTFTNSDSNPMDIKIFGNYAYFSAYNPSDGREVWRTDGTIAGTELISDIQSPSANELIPGLESVVHRTNILVGIGDRLLLINPSNGNLYGAKNDAASFAEELSVAHGDGTYFQLGFPSENGYYILYSDPLIGLCIAYTTDGTNFGTRVGTCSVDPNLRYRNYFEFDTEGYAQGKRSGLIGNSSFPDLLVRFGEPGRPMHVLGSFGSSIVRIYNLFVVRGKVFTFFDRLAPNSVVFGAFVPGPDECPDDDLKDTPGFCGCGIRDLIDITTEQPTQCEIKNTNPEEGSEREAFIKDLTPRKPKLSMSGKKVQVAMEKIRGFSYLITFKIMKGKKVKKTATLTSKQLTAYKKFKDGTKLKVSYVLVGKYFRSKISKEVGFKVQYKKPN